MVNVNGVLNHYDLSGHVAVVTGGTKGIGLGIVRTLLAGGARVVVAGRDERTGKAALEELDAGDAALFVATDVTSQKSCEALIDAAVETYGFLDILVNNAGGFGKVTPIAEMTDEEWNRTIALNLNSTFWCTRRAIPHMTARNWGRILSISSRQALEPLPGSAHYATTKRAVHAFTRSLCREVGPFGVTANVICPGLVITETVEALIEGTAAASGATAEEFYEMRRQQAPIKRLVTVDEIGAYAGFLFSEAGGAVTGQILSADGGSAEH